MSSHRHVISFLQKHELIDPKSIVERGLLIEDISRRNRNFKIIREEDTCYLLKYGVGYDRIATIANEATVYKQLQSKNDRFVNFLPHFYGYDSEDNILILELVRDAENFREYHSHSGRFSKTLATATGKGLAMLHFANRMEESGKNDFGLSIRTPWILNIHHPSLGVFRDFSSANIHLIKILQQFDEFSELLDKAAQGWRAQTLIHADLKWDNCITFSHTDSGRKTRLKIVDWELAGWGDACWDVGSVFADYLTFWLLSIPITGETTPEDFPKLARYPLERMHPALQAFWQSYRQTMDLSAAESNQRLLRSVKYGAIRLLQTAIEQMQMSLQLTGNIICFLQVCLNILRRPQEATVHLMGIPFS